MDQPSLGMPSREYYLKRDDEQYKSAYLQYMIDLAIVMGASPENATRDMNDVLRFEIELANVKMK